MPVPTRDEIFKHFQLMGEGRYEEFMQMVDENVEWTIMGTSPMSETFPNLRSFQEKTLARLRPILKDPGLRIKVKHVIGGGPQDEWASCELGAEAECVDGQPYHMTYNWNCRFDPASGKIVQVRAYLDTALLTKVLRENEDKNCAVYQTPTGI